MKSSLLIFMALFILYSCNNKKLKNEGLPQNKVDSSALNLLNSIYGGGADIFDEEWIDANCTPDMKQTLIDAYDYDGEGFGSWIMGGWEAGEDFAQNVLDISNDGSNYFVMLEPNNQDFAVPVKGHRVICFTIVTVGGLPKIDKCEWVENYEWIE